MSAAGLTPATGRRRRDPLRVLAALVTVALAVLLGLSAWRIYLDWTRPPPPAEVRATPGARPPPAPSPPRVDPARLAQLDLFGRAAPGPTQAPPPDPRDAPETRLNLTLIGVLSSPDEGTARAIIDVPGEDEKQYRVGEALTAGAEIAEIHADRVLLVRNGRYETLWLRRDEPVGTGRAAASAPDPAAALRGAIRQARPGLPAFRKRNPD